MKRYLSVIAAVFFAAVGVFASAYILKGITANTKADTEIVQTAEETEAFAAKKKSTATTKAVKKIVTTTKAAAKTTSRKSILKSLVDRVMGDGNADAVAFLGYRKSVEGWYYTDDKDCWQANLGYNETYDKCAPLAAMYIDKLRIRFTYGKYDWMVQLWKGQYGWLLVGAEIGLYTAPAGTYNSNDIGNMNHYDCAAKENWLNMQLDCYWAKNNNGHYEKIFTRPYGKYWWPTGFVKGQLTKYSAPRTELKTKNRITFKDATMATIFVNGLKQSGFVRAAGSKQLVDDSYYQNGADVWVLWATKDHECFAGYEA